MFRTNNCSSPVGYFCTRSIIPYIYGCLAANTVCLLTSFFDVLLTVHLSIILVINQLDAQILYIIINLLYASTCFEHYVLIIRRSKLYYTASVIITLCRWPSRAQVERVLSQTVHRTATYCV